MVKFEDVDVMEQAIVGNAARLATSKITVNMKDMTLLLLKAIKALEKYPWLGMSTRTS